MQPQCTWLICLAQQDQADCPTGLKLVHKAPADMTCVQSVVQRVQSLAEANTKANVNESVQVSHVHPF